MMALIDKEPHAYLVNVYYDILDDFDCLWTIYRFDTKEIAEQFIDVVPFVCSEVEYSTRPRTDDGHAHIHPFRPTFSSLQDALEDAKEFEKYGDAEDYKYSGRIFKVNMSEIEKQHDQNTIRTLRKENIELKSKVVQLQAELASIQSG